MASALLITQDDRIPRSGSLDADRKEGFGRCRLEALFAMSNAFGIQEPDAWTLFVKHSPRAPAWLVSCAQCLPEVTTPRRNCAYRHSLSLTCNALLPSCLGGNNDSKASVLAVRSKRKFVRLATLRDAQIVTSTPIRSIRQIVVNRAIAARAEFLSPA